MDSCGSCGAYIPKGQRYCSMCYGDPYYGSDGYYLNWLEEQARQEWEKEQAAQQQPEPEPEQ
jgi:hypothetical protein